MKLVIIIVVALLLLVGGGGAAAFFLFFNDPNSSIEDVVEIYEPPKYLTVEVIEAPLINQNKIVGYYLVQFALQLERGTEPIDISPKLPIIQDAFIATLYKVQPIGTSLHKPMDLEKAKEALLKTVQKVVGEGMVKEVLLIDSKRAAR